MMDGTHVTDLSAAYALGALSPSEMTHVESHVAECADCRADLAQMCGVVSALPLACERVEPRAELGDRIMRAAGVELQARQLLAAGSAARSAPAGARPARSVPLWFGGLAAAAVLAMGFVTLDVVRQRNALRSTVTQLAAQVNELRANSAALSSQVRHEQAVVAKLAGGEYWSFKPWRDSNGLMWHCAIVQPATRGRNGMVVASLPEPPRGMAYEVWLKRHGAVRKAAMLMHGGMTMLDMEMPVQRGDVVAISVEPMYGSVAPTSPPMMQMVL